MRSSQLRLIRTSRASLADSGSCDFDEQAAAASARAEARSKVRMVTWYLQVARSAAHRRTPGAPITGRACAGAARPARRSGRAEDPLRAPGASCDLAQALLGGAADRAH